MSSLTNASQLALLQLIWQGVAWPYGGTNVYISLHNGNPGEGGSQTTNETAYSNYARVPVPLSSGSWIVSGGNPAQAQNLQQFAFPVCGATGDTLTYWGAGTALSGAGNLITSGPLAVGGTYGFSALAGAPLVLTMPSLISPLSVNAPVMMYAIGPGMLLPSGVTEGQIYYVGTSGGVNVTLSTTLNNANPVNSSGGGTGILLPTAPLVVSLNIAPTFPVGQLISYLD